MFWFILKCVIAGVVVMLSKLWLLLLRFFYFATTITFDKLILQSIGARLRIPRTPTEILSDKPRFFQLLQRKGVLPKTAKLVDMRISQQIETEPDKAKTSVALHVVYTTEDEDAAEKQKMKDIFVKSQSGAGMPLWLQAIRAAAEPGIAREVDFYNNLSAVVPLSVPGVYFATKLPRFNVVCIVLEHFDLKAGNLCVIPDHAFESVEKVGSMLDQVAVMHGKFLGRTKTDKATRWIPAQEGLKMCEWIRTLGMKDEDVGYVAVYKAIEGYFEKHPLTLLHGDCRPGNMIFSTSNDKDVIFADWEAVNVGPSAWDFTYATVLGLPPKTRRQQQQKLLERYYSSLEESVDTERRKLLRSQQQMAEDVIVLTLVLFYLSRAVMKVEAWKNQGNTSEDVNNWRLRVAESIDDIQPIVVARLLDVLEDHIQKVKDLAVEYGKGVRQVETKAERVVSESTYCVAEM